MDKNLTKKLHNVFYVCQSWIDDVKYVPASFRQKSYSDDFFEKIIQKLSEEMIAQKCCFQTEKVYLPTSYVVEISEDDSSEWQGAKREILLHSLNNFLESEFRSLGVEVSDKDFVEIKVSALQKGEIKVTHFWRESYSPEIEFNHYDDDKTSTGVKKATVSNIQDKEIYRFEDDAVTIVKARSEKLFSLEISKGENRQRVIPIFQPSLTLGRSAQEDIFLPDDPEISRHHLVITYQTNNNFVINMIGQNPVFIRQTPLFTGQSTYCSFGESVEIGNYRIKIHP